MVRSIVLEMERTTPDTAEESPRERSIELDQAICRERPSTNPWLRASFETTLLSRASTRERRFTIYPTSTRGFSSQVLPAVMPTWKQPQADRDHRVGDEERRFHASSPSTSGKTNEKPSYIQTRQQSVQHCNIALLGFHNHQAADRELTNQHPVTENGPKTWLENSQQRNEMPRRVY